MSEDTLKRRVRSDEDVDNDDDAKKGTANDGSIESETQPQPVAPVVAAAWQTLVAGGYLAAGEGHGILEVKRHYQGNGWYVEIVLGTDATLGLYLELRLGKELDRFYGEMVFGIDSGTIRFVDFRVGVNIGSAFIEGSMGAGWGGGRGPESHNPYLLLGLSTPADTFRGWLPGTTSQATEAKKQD